MFISGGILEPSLGFRDFLPQSLQLEVDWANLLFKDLTSCVFISHSLGPNPVHYKFVKSLDCLAWPKVK